MARTADAAKTDIKELSVTTITDPAINAAVTTAIVDQFSAVIITTTTTGNAQTLQNLTDTTKTKRFSVINNDTSTDSITVNGEALGVGEVIFFIWDGTAWVKPIAPAGAGTGDMLISTYDPALISQQLVGLSATQTLTNKTLDADGTGNVITNIGSSEIKSEIITGQTTVTGIAGDFVLITDGSDTDNLKKVNLSDLLGGAGDMTTAVYDPAAINEQLVGLTATQTLTNKSLTSPVIGTITNTGTLTLPISTDTLTGRSTTDTLTNKTIDADGTGNVLTNIGSSEIKSEIITGQTTVTGVSGDFVLISDTSDTGNLKKVDAVDFLGGGTISSNIATATAVATTTSTTYVVITGMTITPGAGTYLAMFSSSGHGTAANQQMMYAIFDDGVIISHTERELDFDSSGTVAALRFTMHTQDIVTVADAEAIDVRFQISTGTFTVNERSLVLIKLS